MICSRTRLNRSQAPNTRNTSCVRTGTRKGNRGCQSIIWKCQVRRKTTFEGNICLPSRNLSKKSFIASREPWVHVQQRVKSLLHKSCFLFIWFLMFFLLMFFLLPFYVFTSVFPNIHFANQTKICFQKNPALLSHCCLLPLFTQSNSFGQRQAGKGKARQGLGNKNTSCWPDTMFRRHFTFHDLLLFEGLLLQLAHDDDLWCCDWQPLLRLIERCSQLMDARPPTPFSDASRRKLRREVTNLSINVHWNQYYSISLVQLSIAHCVHNNFTNNFWIQNHEQSNINSSVEVTN